jgi:hypothetical protein
MKKSEFKKILDSVSWGEHLSGEEIQKVFNFIGLSGPWESQQN